MCFTKTQYIKKLSATQHYFSEKMFIPGKKIFPPENALNVIFPVAYGITMASDLSDIKQISKIFFARAGLPCSQYGNVRQLC
jgi:hypothetical protein